MANNNNGAGSGESRKSDTIASGGVGTVDDKTMPKDGRVMISILKDIGVMDFEPRVVNQLLDFSYRYISTILEDAKVFSAHARKKLVDLDDVKLAVRMHTDHNLINPPPRDLLLEVAARRNAIPLPIAKQCGGLRLPPDRYCLTATNYRLNPKKKRGPGSKSHTVTGGGGGYRASYSINSMNSIPYAHKSKINQAGKIPMSIKSSVEGTPTFAVIPISNKTGTNTGVSSSTISTPETAEASPASCIKIKNVSATAAIGLNQTNSTQHNTTAKVQIQQEGVATTSPIFSTTVKPSLLNSTGVKRKAELMENDS